MTSTRTKSGNSSAVQTSSERSGSRKPTTLITGASFGIGASLARVFAAHGHDLVLVARSAAKLKSLAKSLSSEHGVRVDTRARDLGEPGSARALARSLDRAGVQVEILVNNAGVLEHGAFTGMAPEAHQRMIRLNVAALTDMVSWFAPSMCERGSGRIMNVASIAAFQPFASLATYAATKAYILHLSEALHEELRESGVSVTALCPGITDTHMIDPLRESGSGARLIPGVLVSDVESVAREGYAACMKGIPIVVPGAMNKLGTLLSRSTPKWLTRRITGAIGKASM